MPRRLRTTVTAPSRGRLSEIYTTVQYSTKFAGPTIAVRVIVSCRPSLLRSIVCILQFFRSRFLLSPLTFHGAFFSFPCRKASGSASVVLHRYPSYASISHRYHFVSSISIRRLSFARRTTLATGSSLQNNISFFPFPPLKSHAHASPTIGRGGLSNTEPEPTVYLIFNRYHNPNIYDSGGTAPSKLDCPTVTKTSSQFTAFNTRTHARKQLFISTSTFLTTHAIKRGDQNNATLQYTARRLRRFLFDA